MTRAPVVYFAHPIDHVDRVGTQSDWTHTRAIRDAKHLLGVSGFVVYDPAQAFQMLAGSPPHNGLERVNRAALAQCDALVACYPEDRSIGVAMEIEAARAQGLPILVLTDVGSTSWSLAGITAVTEVRMEHLRKLGETCDGLQTSTPPRMGVVRDSPDVPMPFRSYPGDAGFDLSVSQDTTVFAHGFVDVPCGVSVQFPPGVWGMITGRSSTLRKHQLMVAPGIIDQGYRGPLFAGVQNLGDTDFTAKAGMRLAQLIPFPLVADTLTPVEVTYLNPTERNTAGFGSSGE